MIWFKQYLFVISNIHLYNTHQIHYNIIEKKAIYNLYKVSLLDWISFMDYTIVIQMQINQSNNEINILLSGGNDQNIIMWFDCWEKLQQVHLKLNEYV